MRTVLVVLTVTLIAPGCNRRHCVPAELAERKYVDVSGGAEARASVGPSRLREVEAEFQRRTTPAAPPARPYNFLALSGGGFYSAFGVGVLTGWTESGTRPEFDAVTGISSGALIATFAFLGPRYDAPLYEAMVGVERKDLLGHRIPPAHLFAPSLFNNRRFRQRIDKYITTEVVAEVAAAHAAGRRLYVGTTDVDRRKLVIWDMGAIATRGTPEALELYRTVLTASASVPLAFPPVRIPVEVDGHCYDELHVDGAASDEVIFRRVMVEELNRANGLPGSVAPAGSVLYVLNNGKVYAEPSCVPRRVFPLVSASFASVRYGKSRDELFRVYLNCLETGVLFRSTALPQDVPVDGAGPLGVSNESQRRFYQAGVEEGRRPGAAPGWRDLPVGADPGEQTMPRAGTRFVTEPR
ncbi:patatin-like phospholipase family protein [Urbifossiella limnaea]|uniref:Patatin-like phospholipase n=1 Tax=Urbifossiella limnaea TaxID=2528023 RepID=A0A517XYZ6_9BACT|nr:patatin-like phospholipase family protein [Urbifossiella limnaea]QDU22693.1 Patatin-like phospholipase [Urbifossiella limnaea]